jgi:hypothetical protein
MQIEQPSEGKYDMPVVWYYAPKDAKTFRGVNAFTSGIWDRDTPAQPPELGEQPPYGYPYYGGENQWGYIGQCKVGTDDQFANGLTADEIAHPPATPLPGCCKAPARPGLVIGDRTVPPVIPPYDGCAQCFNGTWPYWSVTIAGCTSQLSIFNGTWYFGPPNGCLWPIVNPNASIKNTSNVNIVGPFPSMLLNLFGHTGFPELHYVLVTDPNVCIGPNLCVFASVGGSGLYPPTVLITGSPTPPDFPARIGVRIGDRSNPGPVPVRSGVRLGDRSLQPAIPVRSGLKIGDRSGIAPFVARSGLQIGDRTMRVLYMYMTDYLDFPVAGIAPAPIGAGPTNGQAIDMTLHPSVMWTLYVNSVGGAGTVDMKLQQSATGTGGWTDITGSAITQISSSHQLVTVEADAGSLSPGNTFARAVVTVANNACSLALIVMVADNSGNDPIVTQRINISV